MMGKVIMSGIVPQLVVPVTGIPAGDLAVGSSVYLMENGSAVEYLVVNHGIPSGSSLYDASCDGTWLLRKNIYINRRIDDDANNYANSEINTYLNGEFFAMLGNAEKTAIKQVKIPYCIGNKSTTVNSGANGLSTKIFLLAADEVHTNALARLHDGDPLDYFSGGGSRVAYLDGVASAWWLRTVDDRQETRGVLVSKSGSIIADSYSVTGIYGIRPALILPNTSIFDEETLILKGVA